MPPLPIERRQFLELMGAAGLVVQGSLLGLSTGCKREAGDTGADDDVFHFAVITDTHLHADPEHHNGEVLAETLAILEDFEVPVSFVVITGDVLDELPSDDPADYQGGEETALNRLQDILAGTSLPVHIVMGNHDYYLTDGSLDNGLTDDPSARELLYQQLLGMPAPFYAFEEQGVRFLALNSMQQDERVDWSPETCGSFGEDQLAWLEEQLTDGTPCFLFFHHPLALDTMVDTGLAVLWPFEVPRDEGNYDKYEGTEYDGWTDPIYDLLEQHADTVRAVFVGHGHWFLEDSWQGIPVMMGDSVGNSVLQTSVGEGDAEQPMRYHLVEVNLTQGTFAIFNRSWIQYNV